VKPRTEASQTGILCSVYCGKKNASSSVNDADRYVIIKNLFHSVFTFLPVLYAGRSRDSVVGIATGYELDGRVVGVRVPIGARIFSTASRPAQGPIRPPIQWVREALSPGVKRQRREADHSPSTSGEVKKMWIYTPTTPYAFMA
jgi:hypothetical protein